MEDVEITLRAARGDDAEAIAAAEWATAQTPGLLAARPGEIPASAFAAKIEALKTRGRYIVAEHRGRLVGHAFLDPMEMQATAHVCRLTIVVHPGHRGRGIGRAMLRELLAWAAADPRVLKVELNVRATNEAAIRLYRSFGFVEEGRLRRRIRLPDGAFLDDLAMGWLPAKETTT